MGLVEYAWIPWSKLSNAYLAIAPHGAFVYKNTTNDNALVYVAINRVPIDSPEADLVFGVAEPFCPAANTFEDITSRKVNCSDDEVMNERIRTGLNCSKSPTSYTETKPFVFYNMFAWVSDDALSGGYVYELADGTGLVQHSSIDGMDDINMTVATTTGDQEGIDELVEDIDSPSGALILRHPSHFLH